MYLPLNSFGALYTCIALPLVPSPFLENMHDKTNIVLPTFISKLVARVKEPR